jgi:hypothetical protein
MGRHSRGWEETKERFRGRRLVGEFADLEFTACHLDSIARRQACRSLAIAGEQQMRVSGELKTEGNQHDVNIDGSIALELKNDLQDTGGRLAVSQQPPPGRGQDKGKHAKGLLVVLDAERSQLKIGNALDRDFIGEGISEKQHNDFIGWPGRGMSDGSKQKYAAGSHPHCSSMM